MLTCIKDKKLVERLDEPVTWLLEISYSIYIKPSC